MTRRFGHYLAGMFAATSPSSLSVGEGTLDAASGELSSQGRGAAPKITFDTVYTAHFGFVWRAVRGLGVNAHSVDDVTQEVFLVVHRRLGTLEEPKALKSWLFGIARRVTKDHRRALGRRGKSVELDTERAPNSDTDPERHHSGKQSIAIVARYADSLDEERRALFFLALVEGMSVAEASEVLGSNTNTTYSRVRAMRKELSELLGISAEKGSPHGPT
jgi:RNA polymerase sigma-70 factor, ECF subfamily